MIHDSRRCAFLIQSWIEIVEDSQILFLINVCSDSRLNLWKKVWIQYRRVRTQKYDESWNRKLHTTSLLFVLLWWLFTQVYYFIFDKCLFRFKIRFMKESLNSISKSQNTKIWWKLRQKTSYYIFTFCSTLMIIHSGLLLTNLGHNFLSNGMPNIVWRKKHPSGFGSRYGMRLPNYGNTANIWYCIRHTETGCNRNSVSVLSAVSTLNSMKFCSLEVSTLHSQCCLFRCVGH